MSDSISPQLLRQRIRNNIIDYLQMAASAEEQREFERNAPMACVPDEMINLWEDAVIPTEFEWYSGPVFTPQENAAIRSFHIIWDRVADETPSPMPSTIEALIGTPPWDRLMEAAKTALSAFQQRGRFSADTEEPSAVLRRGGG